MIHLAPDFARDADQLRKEEFVRLKQGVVPTVAYLRQLHDPQLRELIVSMLTRSNFEVQTEATYGNLVTRKDGKTVLVAIAPANKSAVTPVGHLMRLRDEVVREKASRGIFVTTRGLSLDAVNFAKAAAI